MTTTPTTPTLPDHSTPLGRRERAAVWRRRLPWKLREYCQFDAGLLKSAIGLSGVAATGMLRLLGKADTAASWEATLHRGAYSTTADQMIERRLQRTMQRDRSRFASFIDNYGEQPSTAAFFRDPRRLLGTRALVLKSPRGQEKGVLALDYFFVFPLFAKLFDIEAIAERYYLLLEPSWSGYCNFELLCYLAYDFPVFVQTYEPRDFEFVQRLSANFVPIPIAANWWVDHRVFRPLADSQRDADVLMIATWAKFKRHDAVFAALAKVRSRGVKLKTVLVGYPGDMSQNDLWRLARFHGVADQLEIFERVSAEEVNQQLNRVKVNVVWSRREGVNRAIIEGMFANTPCILRRGFNYGYEYPYLNDHTGRFATEATLPETLLHFTRESPTYSPRAWIEEYLGPEIATRIVDEQIGRYAAAHGAPWTPGQLEVKTTLLDGMSYWDETKRAKFVSDYAFLESMLRSGVASERRFGEEPSPGNISAS